jgi:hypothetical protein
MRLIGLHPPLALVLFLAGVAATPILATRPGH